MELVGRLRMISKNRKNGFQDIYVTIDTLVIVLIINKQNR